MDMWRDVCCNSVTVNSELASKTDNEKPKANVQNDTLFPLLYSIYTRMTYFIYQNVHYINMQDNIQISLLYV